MSASARIVVRTLAVLLLLCSATRPAFADGVWENTDGFWSALVGLGIVVIFGLVLIVWLLRSLGRRLVAAPEKQAVAEAEIPVGSLRESRTHAMSWRRIPPPLRIAVVLDLAIFAIYMGVRFVGYFPFWVQLVMAASAARYATSVLFAIGALDLSRQLVGVARRGAQIALVAALLQLTFALLWEVTHVHESWASAAGRVVSYGSVAAELGLVVGFAIVARRRFPRLAVAGIVVAVATRLPLLLTELREIGTALTGLHSVLVLVLVLAASTEHDVTMPELAERGFRHAARGLWLRMAAVGLVPVLALLTTGGADGIIKTATPAAALISVVSLTYLGIGAISAARARLAELHAGPLYASGVSALVCAGLTVAQMSGFYESLEHNSFGNIAGPWSILAPLVAIASLAYLTRAITGFATRRQLHDLRTRSSGGGAVACVLLFVSFAITAWLSADAKSEGSIVFLLLVSLVCALSGTIMLARLCAAAADAVRNSSPTLPTATVT